MAKFTVFWLTGNSQIVTGSKIHIAMNNAGIGAGALRAMDFYAPGDQRDNYEWDKKNRTWLKK